MSIAVTLFGSTRYIPESKERNWGSEGTSVLVDLCNSINGLFSYESSVPRLRFSVTNTSPGAGATLTPTHNVHRVSGSGGAVTRGAVTAIADGTAAEQILVVRGLSNVNTVTIPATSNVLMNGPITLGDGDEIMFLWDATTVKWKEMCRSN